MGIPSYFSYIVKNHPTIIKKYIKDILKVDNLYLDCNSIIYDAYSKMDTNKLTDSVSTTIIRQVIIKIEDYIRTVNPSKSVLIAFDGVAPVAKLEQQRNRRYKSWYQNEISRSVFNKDTVDPWNTTSITPGTKFMYDLNHAISDHFSRNTINNLDIVVSGSNEVGEGEHKIFAFIRSEPEKHSSETTVVYGLDADLIMLSLNHLSVCPQLYLFRETPHFIQSIDSSLEPESDYFLDIPEFADALIKHIANDAVLSKEEQMAKIHDYLFLCFFLGNDFLPHFPALNIRTGGVDKLMNAYKATIGEKNLNLTANNGETILWGNLRRVVQQLADQEEEFIIKEHLSRNKKERYKLPQETPEEKLKNFESTPLYERDMEKFINPVKPGWQSRYYQGLFGIHSNTVKDIAKKEDIAINYLQGLEWTMKYYTVGCPDWRFKYKYHYPPLLQDLIRFIPMFDRTFVPQQPFNPVSEIVQLCYVLPRPSLNLLPKKLYFQLIRKYDHWYKGDCEFVWAYCRYFWEAHVEMAEINIEELENFIEEHRHLL